MFSLGCVLFECLTGRPHFTGEHVAAVLAKILFDEAPRLRDVQPELPRQLDDLVARMLANEAGSRPPDGAALVLSLRDLPTLGDLSPPTRTVPDQAARARRSSARRLPRPHARPLLVVSAHSSPAARDRRGPRPRRATYARVPGARTAIDWEP